MSERDRAMNRCIENIPLGGGILLGAGGFGVVYRYKDNETKYDFAVKTVPIIPNDSVSHEINSLVNEINLYTKLSKHRRIIRYFGTHRDDHALYIFMEYMPNGSIGDYLSQHGPMSPDVIGWYTKQILDGLDFLHQNNIIHRDIKGANILRDCEENIKICDFGISKYLGTITSGGRTIGGSDNVAEMAVTDCGTPYWMAPEIIISEPYNTKADIWSLGATVVEMLTGKHPYPDLDALQAMLRIGHTGRLEYTPPQPISPSLQSFIDQMLVADPIDRASIETLLDSNFINSVTKIHNWDIKQLESKDVIINNKPNKGGDIAASPLSIYERGDMIGRGAFGEVYKCVHTITGIRYAMKKVKIGLGDEVNKEVKSLEREIKLYTKLCKHPQIVEYYHTWRDHKDMYIFLEYMPGGSIKNYLYKHGPLPSNIIARYSKQILQGLQFLHQNNIIHRDIKGDNILRDDKDNVKLCDFGICRFLQTITLDNTVMGCEMAHTMIGTAYWMAPEILDEQPYNELSDVWSLGATVIEMVTAKHPYPNLDPIPAMFQIGKTGKLKYELPGPIPEELKSFIDLILVADPQGRANIDTLLRSKFIMDYN